MPDLRDDLRAYIDYLADRAAESVDREVVTTVHSRKPRGLVIVAVASMMAIIIAGLVMASGSDDRVAKPKMNQLTGTWRMLETTLGSTAYDFSTSVFWTGEEVITISPEHGGDDVTGEIRSLTDGSVRRIAPSGLVWRSRPAVVWTGSEVIVAGGGNGPGIDIAAAAYNPTADTWRVLPPPPGFVAVTSENQVAGPAVWTGTEMISWQSGLAFDPASDTWRELTPSPLQPRFDEAVVMTDAGVFVWGGCDIAVSNQCDETRGGDEFTDGAIYDPAADAWLTIPEGPLGAGDDPTAVWTGEEVIVGINVPADETAPDVAAYNPRTDTWRGLPASPHPGGHYAVTVWTGDVAVTHGGYAAAGLDRQDLVQGEVGVAVTGATTALDPTTGQWTRLPDGPPRDRHTATWAGDRMIVAGGYPTSTPWELRIGPKSSAVPLSATNFHPVSDAATTVQDLKRRPLVPVRLGASQPCPQARVTSDVTGVGAVVQVGPVAAGFLVPAYAKQPALYFGEEERRIGDTPERGWHRRKVLWLIRASTPGPVIIRGTRIDKPGPIRWFQNGNDPTLVVDGDARSTAPNEWRDDPTAIFVRESGCYFLQIDGPDFQATLILRARPTGQR